MHHTTTSTLHNIVSELQTLPRNVLAWYGRLVHLVRTFKQRTNVPFPYLHNKSVYRTSAPYFLAKLEAYRTVLPSLHSTADWRFVFRKCNAIKAVSCGHCWTTARVRFVTSHFHCLRQRLPNFFRRGPDHYEIKGCGPDANWKQNTSI